MQFDTEVDVIVVGSGCAGSSAALGAYYGGAKSVLLCEKAKSLFGGTTNLAGGGWLWCPNNRYLKAIGVQQDPQEVFDLLQDLAFPKGTTKDAGDLECMRAFAYEWPKVVETMQQQNFFTLKPVEVRDPPEDSKLVEQLLKQKVAANPTLAKKIGVADNIDKLKHLMPSYCAHHELDFCPSGKVLAPDGATTSGFFKKAVKKHSDVINLKFNTQVVDIIFDPEIPNKVIGAVVLDRNTNKTSNVRAKHGVIFGSGGFSSNEKLKEEAFKKYGATFYGSCSATTNTGDFAEICKRHNIELSGLDLGWFKQTVIPKADNTYPHVFFLNVDSGIVVDKFGKRFANEKDFYQERGLQMLEKQKERHVVFFVYDERASKIHDGPIKSLGGPIPFEGAAEEAILSASSVKELTQKLKEHMKKYVKDKSFTLDSDFEKSLEQQLERFNNFAKKGKDEEFQRGENVAKVCWHTPRRDNVYPNKTMHPIDKNNLKLLIFGLSTLDTKGGPRINKNAQVLKAWKAVENLYGCGNCVRSWTNKSYPASGTTIASGVFFGFTAGVHAMRGQQKL